MINPLFLTDSYKISHKMFEHPGTSVIYSNFTPRFTKHFKDLYPDFDDKILWFGLQGTLQYLFSEVWSTGFFLKDWADIEESLSETLTPYINMTDFSHFKALHTLGYLPIHVKALPEGSLVNPGIPCFTITNTDPNFSWLPNYLETIISAELWKPMTVATVGRQFRKLINQFAMDTQGNLEGTDFQLHDFSFRGQSGWQSSAANGAGFLLNTLGTDNIPAIHYLKTYYYAKHTEQDPIAFSVPATEHSVATLGILSNNCEDKLEGEKAFLRDVITNKFPSGIVSYVADSYDYWSVLTDILPSLKEEILARDGTLVIRPDSGDPVKVVCGYKVLDLSDPELYKQQTDVGSIFPERVYVNLPSNNISIVKTPSGQYFKLTSTTCKKTYFVVEDEISEAEVKGSIELLWDIFGGTVNELGYKVLNSKIGLIYGDGITYTRAKEILQSLKDKGFASTSVVFGVGSFSLSSGGLSRDSLGSAIKATNAIVDGNSLPLCKEPKTDISKKSARGLLHVSYDEATDKFVLTDNCTPEKEEQGLLQTVFHHGLFYNHTTLTELRNKLK